MKGLSHCLITLLLLAAGATSPLLALDGAEVKWQADKPVYVAAREAASQDSGTGFVERTREQIRDSVYGGWMGMLIGGIEGLPHEFKYVEEPRQDLPDYPLLPNGARTDDDNDIEWMHLYFMDKENVFKIPYPRLAEIWKANMNQGVWCANERARKLMDQGFQPPETSDPARNSFSSYNLAGQFSVECYGMVAPGMPRTAADLGLHYARVAVSGEPLQAAQYWTALISLAAVSGDSMEELLVKSLGAVDSVSAQAEAVRDAIEQFHAHPQDWKAARRHFHDKWFIKSHKTAPGKWNDNSTPLNGALVALALLYGGGDFYQTGQYAMALGYDADCNTATACAVVGTRMGFSAVAKLPNFQMPDHYENRTRPQLPKECKVSEQVDAMMRICERLILANGGAAATIDGKPSAGNWYFSQRAGRYYWSKWGGVDLAGNKVQLPQYNWGTREWQEEAERIVRFWMDTGIDGMIIDAVNWYVNYTWEMGRRRIIDVINSYGNAYSQPEGGGGFHEDPVTWITEGGWNSVQDYGLGIWWEAGSDVLQNALKTGNPRPIEKALRNYHDRVVAAGGVLYFGADSRGRSEGPEQRRLAAAVRTLSGILLAVGYGGDRNPQDPEILRLLELKRVHSALYNLSTRRHIPTKADDKHYAFLRTAKDGSERILVVMNFQSTPQSVAVDMSGVAAAGLVDLRDNTTTPRQNPFQVELPAYGYGIYQVKALGTE